MDEDNSQIDYLKNELKPLFVEHYKELLGNEYEEFVRASSEYQRKAVRVNTLKKSVEEIRERLEEKWVLEQVPWCAEGFWMKYRDGKRFDIGNTPEHQLGYIYVQDAASMIPVEVLNPSPGDIVLDMCAAPGSKTSQIAQKMGNKGLLVANDADGKRLGALGINLQRMGIHNSMITRMEGFHVKKQGEGFDKILVDAPCTGTGTIMKTYKVIGMWSHSLIDRMKRIQYKLASHAFTLLKPGGTMVYSTCTLEPEENEGVITKLLKKHPEAELLDIKFSGKKSQPVTEFKGNKYDPNVKKCLRIHPQDNGTEGFFVAKIKKNN